MTFSKLVVAGLFVGVISLGTVFLLDQPSQVITNNLAYEKMTQTNSASIILKLDGVVGDTIEGDRTLPELTSLSGIDINFALSTDAANHLIIDERIKDVFDTYLSALGEVSLEIIIEHIRSHLSGILAEPALSESYELLDQYIAYQQALSDLQSYLNEQLEGMDDIERLQFKKEKLSQLRHDFFSGDVYAAFFAKEEQYDLYMLEKLKIEHNSTLSIDEKAAALESIRTYLPEHVKVARNQAMRYGNLHEAVEMMRDNGATEQDVYEQRANELGEEAAQALAELDITRQKWQIRVDTFVLRKQEIEGSSLSVQDKQLAIEEVLNQSFTDIERLRVKALTSTF